MIFIVFDLLKLNALINSVILNLYFFKAIELIVRAPFKIIGLWLRMLLEIK